MDWFLHDNGPRHERVKKVILDHSFIAFFNKHQTNSWKRISAPQVSDFGTYILSQNYMFYKYKYICVVLYIYYISIGYYILYYIYIYIYIYIYLYLCKYVYTLLHIFIHALMSEKSNILSISITHYLMFLLKHLKNLRFV